MKLDVYAFGSALMDIQVQVQDGLLDELEIQKGNMYLTDRNRQEAVLKKILASDSLDMGRADGRLQTAAGGSAANTVFGIARLGGRAGLCGKVADDRFGNLYGECMRDSGVVFHQKKTQGMTGTCIVLITDDAQRTMLTCLGVSSEITLSDIDHDLLRSSAYVYLEGYLFDSPLATGTMMETVDTAKKNGVKIALTASDAFCVDRHKDIFLELVKRDVDLLFANAQEAQSLSGAGSIDEALDALADMCPQIAITDGAQGSWLRLNGTTYKIDAFSTTALDTTGAGDAYAAGLLYGFTNGRSPAESGQIASFFASRVVARVGPRYAGDIKTELKIIIEDIK